MATFREEYEGMPDREILIDMAARVRTLEENERKRPACPSPKCAIHDEEIDDLDDRLSTIEEKEKDRRENKRTWRDHAVTAVVAVVSAMLGAVAGNWR